MTETTTPNKALLIALSLVCAACVGVIAFLAHTITLEESGSTNAAWTAVAIVVAIVGLFLALLLRLRKKANA